MRMLEPVSVSDRPSPLTSSVLMPAPPATVKRPENSVLMIKSSLSVLPVKNKSDAALKAAGSDATVIKLINLAA